MLMIIALLVGVLLGLWLLTGVLYVLGWTLNGAYYLAWGLGLTVWATVTGLVNCGRWSYRTVAQWRAQRASAGTSR